MNKEQFAEFHKYLAMIKYEYIKMLYSPNLSSQTRKETNEILKALDKVSQICLIDKYYEVVDNENI